MNAQSAFSVVAVFYSVANLGSMGLEINLRETIKSLRSVRVLALTLGWSWVLGPAFAVLLTKILPMAEPYATGLLIFSLAPTAPALPLFIRKARADMSLAAAIMPLAVCTRNGSAMLVAITAFPSLDPNLMAMILLAVPVPLIVWLALSSFLGFRAGKTVEGGATGLSM
jgi:bile acid:Na+ symporter, BASS family